MGQRYNVYTGWEGQEKTNEPPSKPPRPPLIPRVPWTCTKCGNHNESSVLFFVTVKDKPEDGCAAMAVALGICCFWPLLLIGALLSLSNFLTRDRGTPRQGTCWCKKCGKRHTVIYRPNAKGSILNPSGEKTPVVNSIVNRRPKS